MREREALLDAPPPARADLGGQLAVAEIGLQGVREPGGREVVDERAGVAHDLADASLPRRDDRTAVPHGLQEHDGRTLPRPAVAARRARDGGHSCAGVDVREVVHPADAGVVAEPQLAHEARQLGGVPRVDAVDGPRHDDARVEPALAQDRGGSQELREALGRIEPPDARDQQLVSHGRRGRGRLRARVDHAHALPDARRELAGHGLADADHAVAARRHEAADEAVHHVVVLHPHERHAEPLRERHAEDGRLDPVGVHKRDALALEPLGDAGRRGAEAQHGALAGERLHLRGHAALLEQLRHGALVHHEPARGELVAHGVDEPEQDELGAADVAVRGDEQRSKRLARHAPRPAARPWRRRRIAARASRPGRER